MSNLSREVHKLGSGPGLRAGCVSPNRLNSFLASNLEASPKKSVQSSDHGRSPRGLIAPRLEFGLTKETNPSSLRCIAQSCSRIASVKTATSEAVITGQASSRMIADEVARVSLICLGPWSIYSGKK